jgi:polyhydroxyalkanoate synthase
VNAPAFDPQALRREWQDIAARAAALAQALPAVPTAPAGAPRDAVWTRGRTTLYRYRANAADHTGAGRSRRRPLLIVFALVNRPDVLDLQPGRSLIRGLLAQGLDVYLIDWGRADAADRTLGLDDFLDGALDGAVSHILAGTDDLGALDLLGVCQGGTMSLCYTALHPDRVANLVAMITPVDFRTPDNLLSYWAQGLDVDRIANAGNVPGALLNGLFLAQKPFRLMHQKYFHALDLAYDPAGLESFVRMERWIFDCPDHPAEVFRAFVRDLYQQNRLARGAFEVGGRRVDLRAITQPVLNIYGAKDHLVPPSASIPLGRLIGSRDYTPLELDAGHIGMYVSRAARALPAQIAAWLARSGDRT